MKPPHLSFEGKFLSSERIHCHHLKGNILNLTSDTNKRTHTHDKIQKYIKQQQPFLRDILLIKTQNLKKKKKNHENISLINI